MTASAPPTELPVLEQRYMLLTHIPYYVADDGSVWLERAWHLDFMAHLRYLRRFTLVAPSYPKADQPDLVKVEPLPGAEPSFIALPHQDSRLQAILNLPSTALTMLRAVRSADIVHSSVVGWPYSLGWLANPMARLLDKKLVIVIESAPWRLSGAAHEGPRRKVRAAVTEALARWSINHASLGIFTQPAYRDTLMTHGRGAAHIAPASWISDSDVLDDAAAQEVWRSKPARLRVLFAARLTPEKGVEVLLAAAKLLDERRVELDIDIIGEGVLRERCLAEQGNTQHARVRVLDPVAYGRPFFELLRGYHAALVPTLSDEQPRIVFDAYAQGVPVIASNSDGNRAVIEDGVTGTLFARNDAKALADVLERYTANPAPLQPMGLGSLAIGRRVTHSGMHENRWRILVEQFGYQA